MLRELTIEEMGLVSGGTDDEVISTGTKIPENSISGEELLERLQMGDPEALALFDRGVQCSSCHTSDEAEGDAQFYSTEGGTNNLFTALGNQYDNMGATLGHMANSWAGQIALTRARMQGDRSPGRRQRQESRENHR